MEWPKQFNHDPVKPLIESNNPAVFYFTQRDLLQRNVAAPSASLWTSIIPQRIINRQEPGGYWKALGKNEDFYLVETFKQLQTLVYQYEFDKSHPAVANACEYLFSRQTDEGDFRGFLGNQYAPYYTGVVIALLIKAGYADDPRIEKGFQWLLSMRQNDGGWVIGSPGWLGIPDFKWSDITEMVSDKNAPTLKSFDKSQPFAHSGTGMVLRAFAAHPKYRKSAAAMQAAQLLKSHFLKSDNYNSYKHPDNWLRFEYPFWWNNLAAALDSVSLIGIPPADPDVKKALDWFIANQTETGLWKVSYSKIHKAPLNSKTEEEKLWVSLAICRVFRRYFN
jgi:Squalene-hopene cyclase C-terminal domain